MKGNNENNKVMDTSLFHYLVILISLFFANAVFAQTIKILPNTVIAYPRNYDNVTLDLSSGSFIIKDNATLTITNSQVLGTLTRKIPNLFVVENGKLVMDKNVVSIKSSGIAEHPQTQSLENVIQLTFGNVSLTNNSFKIDNYYTAGFLITTAIAPSTGLNFVNNKFEGFHGVLYLIASDHSLIKNNTFIRNSYGHIVIIGNHSTIENNTIMFSGNYRLGNSIDIIDADNVNIINNRIFTPTCHGIYILNSHNVLVEGNSVFGGITYAMNVYSNPETLAKDDQYLLAFVPHKKMRHMISSNIKIKNNFMSQNRFGVAASDTDKLIVENNTFIHRFKDNDSRKFWTDNQILLQNIKSLTWSNNRYKEAYSQEMSGDDSNSMTLVAFPKKGDVSF